MPSNATRGAYYKARSKRHLERQGFTVFDMEIQRVVYTPAGMLPTKRDQLGSDIAYLTKDIVVFVQVKGGSRLLSVLIREARRAFERYEFPQHSRQELHVWRPRARRPDVYWRDNEHCGLMAWPT